MNSRILALLVAFMLAAWMPSVGAEPKHRVVFELTSADASDWNAVLNNVANLRTALSPVDVEVVAHGKGLGMLVESRNATVREQIKVLAGVGVVFAACENTMKREQVSRSELSALATTVDAGVAEVVRKQEAGWSYVRSGG